MGAFEKLMQEIADDAEKFANTFVEAGVTEASRKIVELTEMALDIFYGSYSPKVYNREFNIRNNTYTPIIRINGESGEGGVQLSSANMHEYWRAGISTESIYDMVMFGGQHGRAAASKPPYDIVKQFVEGAALGNYLKKYAERAAKSQSYKILRF